MNLKKNSSIIVVSCGLLTEIFYLIFVFFGEPRNIPLYMFVYFETFIIFIFAYYFLIKKKLVDTIDSNLNWIKFLIQRILRFNSSETHKLQIPVLIILFGILFRLTLLPTSYTTSDDVHRYFWEGKVVVNGYNPYESAPGDSSLIHLRDDNFEKVTFKNMHAIYPPMSQLIFVIGYSIAGNSQMFLKLIYLIFEAATLIFLLKLLLLKGKDPKLILLYAWLPLPIMEYFINAHLDAVGITFLVLFLYYFEKDKLNLSPFLLALAFLTKLLAVLLLPLIIKKIGVKKSLVFYFIFIITVIIFYLPFSSGNLDLFTGLFKYLAHWEFNGSVYNFFKAILSRADLAKMFCGVLLTLSVFIISFRYKEFLSAVFGVFICMLIFSSTLYPWYLGWISAVNVFFGLTSVLSLFFTINFSNLTPLAPVWKEYPIVWIIEYIPFYSLLIYELYKKKIQL